MRRRRRVFSWPAMKCGFCLAQGPRTFLQVRLGAFDSGEFEEGDEGSQVWGV